MKGMNYIFGVLVMSVFNSMSLNADNYSLNLEQDLTLKYSQNFITKSQKQPIFVLIGGFQGAGKSSLIKRIRKIYKGNVISTDAIRQSLFDLKSVNPADISKYVSSISKNLTLTALKLNSNIFIDANAHAQRVKETETLISSKFPNYILLKIFLKASDKTLKTRVEQRQPQEGCYQGTVEDLNASLKKNQVNLADYDFTLETDHLDEESVAEAVKDFIFQRLK